MKLWKLSGVNKFAPKRDEIPDEIWLENSSSQLRDRAKVALAN